jgi:DNA-binding transcriptional LysR family regulator
MSATHQLKRASSVGDATENGIPKPCTRAIQKCMGAEDRSWDLYRTFLAVVQEGGLSAAARRIGVTQPTAGRHIRALEKSVGSMLFTRSPRGLSATEAALALVPHAEAMAAASEALSRASSGESRGERGTVRLTAGEMMGCEVLPPILAEFSLHYPKIHLELTLSNRNLDLLRRDADIAVRMVRPTQTALVVRRIGVISVGMFAHRRYVEAFGIPKGPDEIARHCLIGFDRRTELMHLASKPPLRLTREHFRFRCDSVAGQLAALRAGAGIGACFVSVGQRNPDLIRVLEHTLSFRREVWLAIHRDARSTRRIRLLFDHLGDRLTANLEGAARGTYANKGRRSGA